MSSNNSASSSTRALVQLATTPPSLALQPLTLPALGSGSGSSSSAGANGPRAARLALSHVAQNPTDVQSLDSNAFGEGTVLGCDVLGIVEEVSQGGGEIDFTAGSAGGSHAGDVAHQVQKGDLLAGLIWGGEHKGLGGYSHHTILPDTRIAFRIDEELEARFGRAALSTLPLAAATAELALFSSSCLGIPQDDDGKKTPVLIWGGSSSVGSYAIQLAALRGLQVYTTASPAHHERLRSLGAHEVLDYRSQDVPALLKERGVSIKHAFDCIGSTPTSQACSQVVGDGTICTVRPGLGGTEKCLKETRKTDVLVWTVFLTDHAYGPLKWPASEEDHSLGVQLFENIPQWLKEGKLVPNQVKLLQGLESVKEGFQMHRDGKLSGEKIVYAI
ncbi:NAD(P)-binding protein [Microstroma glucosiphilum]|uniref:NAD(P)-binding protein n=1 Tax=Pseudomicrostroma glucosiphilum TaxID=1684307 RepID=A0A316U0K0_9BASI|nr:NAD(P)-binding protein [Pseudomicrostroma glucosiphilum]PWN18414.1 NAD(P)-binding protein [Pseudomicrostroma glucosiphilum]